MKGFLEEVAADLYARYGEGLSERAVLFPSRRARLFFVDALGRIAGRPMWQPEWVTIDDLTGEISGLHTGDRVRLITELYKVYSAYHNEPFDKFYFWGDMLLTDFDTIDKYLIDAQMLFRNISEIKEIEADISYLTPAQLRILSFWSSFGEQADLSEEKRRFLAIWKTLGPIYRRFRERLSSLGIAYNGMVQRAAADRIRGGGFAFPEPRRYVVAGFNALSECEKRLFGFLATAAETDFYWDYDSYYKDDPEQEAGMFVRSNVAQFPPRTELRYDNMRGEKQIVSVAAVSNAVQCKYAAAILADLARRRREEDSGIAAGARPALGKETAIAMMEDGVDVILQTCDHTGLGVLEACSEKGVYCLGYTSDQSALVADGLCLTSMLVDIPYMISSQIDLIKAGNYGGQTFPGLHDGVVSMSAFSDKVPADVAEKVNAVIEQIKNGEVVVTPNYSEN